MAYFKLKNLCDESLKIKNLRRQLSCIFHCRGILRFFWRCYLHGEIYSTKLPILTFFKKSKNAGLFLRSNIGNKIVCFQNFCPKYVLTQKVS